MQKQQGGPWRLDCRKTRLTGNKTQRGQTTCILWTNDTYNGYFCRYFGHFHESTTDVVGHKRSCIIFIMKILWSIISGINRDQRPTVHKITPMTGVDTAVNEEIRRLTVKLVTLLDPAWFCPRRPPSPTPLFLKQTKNRSLTLSSLVWPVCAQVINQSSGINRYC